MIEKVVRNTEKIFVVLLSASREISGKHQLFHCRFLPDPRQFIFVLIPYQPTLYDV